MIHELKVFTQTSESPDVHEPRTYPILYENSKYQNMIVILFQFR